MLAKVMSLNKIPAKDLIFVVPFLGVLVRIHLCSLKSQGNVREFFSLPISGNPVIVSLQTLLLTYLVCIFVHFPHQYFTSNVEIKHVMEDWTLMVQNSPC